MGEEMDQSRAPILESIKQYHARRIVPFTTPGHKMGQSIDEETRLALGADTFFNDIPEIEGMDDRHMSKGVLTQAEQLAAKAYGADQTLFSVDGSSLSVHSALLSVAADGDTVLFARNVHKSVMAAIILGNVVPVWLQPAVDEDLEVQHGLTPQQVEEGLRAHPEAKAVLIVSPSYYGTASDVRGIADVCHGHGVPLLVDEAWGPHFAFHPDLPPSGIESGADIGLGSVHKTMNGVQQASVINFKSELIDMQRLTLVFDLFQSTSPSPLIMGSIDGARRQMALHGRELWTNALALSQRLRAAVAEIPGMQMMGREVCRRPEVAGLDETKFVIDVRGLGITGIQAGDWLRDHCAVTVELADQRRIMGLITTGDNTFTVDRLIGALQELARWARSQGRSQIPSLPSIAEIQTEFVMPPRKAFFGAVRSVKLEEAAGEIAAEMISPYPPGIPAISPGERFTQPLVEFLQQGMQLGFQVPDATDPSLETIRVVAR